MRARTLLRYLKRLHTPSVNKKDPTGVLSNYQTRKPLLGWVVQVTSLPERRSSFAIAILWQPSAMVDIPIVRKPDAQMDFLDARMSNGTSFPTHFMRV